MYREIRGVMYDAAVLIDFLKQLKIAKQSKTLCLLYK